MTGMSSATADAFLGALCRNQSYAVGSIYVQLHVGEPGPLGLANPAVETSRQVVTFDPPVSGAIASNIDATWNPITGNEDATFFSAWDGGSGGNFLFSGSVISNPYVSGDVYTIAAGALTASLTVTT